MANDWIGKTKKKEIQITTGKTDKLEKARNIITLYFLTWLRI